ncbi:MAG: hypothetical protein A2W01_11210 [Candidatus Solincola sediminis]|nr:MAG: hypothetical protein A2W01_11210 [Candidatus Solincola sediminis]
MALTFTQKERYSVGGKAFRLYEITHDGSVTTINATDIDMNYIEAAIPVTTNVLSGVADVDRLSGTTSGPFITVVAMTATSTFMLQAWGW